MKKLIAIAVSLLTLSACTKKSSSNKSTTANTSSFTITIKGATYSSTKAQADKYIPASSFANITINVADPTGTLSAANIVVQDNINQIGTFPICGATCNYPTEVVTPSAIYIDDPNSNPSPSCGTVTLTHWGSDYIQGTFTMTVTDNQTYAPYPATGSFKIYY